MSAFIVLGAQWGDEGKGKMTDYLAEEANVVVRYQGGNNAGHTVEVGEKQYKLHLIPSGILHDEKLNVIGNGVVVDPKAFFTEIDYLKEEGVKVTPEKLIVSDRAHVIMPYHKVLDKLKEKARGKNDIGTTGKGIGPCYTDKFERCGIRVCDLIDKEVFKEKLKENIEMKNKYIVNVLGGEALSFDEIYDVYAVRIIVDKVIDCYNCLGIIHDMFTPIPGRFKDYISTPKPNMYQSLHTTVIGREGIPFEVQIRTWEMHRTAEFGIAAHWKYKLGISGKQKLDERLTWIRQLLEEQNETENPEDIVRTIKTDFVPEEVFVFTPKGDVVSLPVGATVIDFAYGIHSAVGHKMMGAKVDGRLFLLIIRLKQEKSLKF